jgi:hypothetical protein
VRFDRMLPAAGRRSWSDYRKPDSQGLDPAMIRRHGIALRPRNTIQTATPQPLMLMHGPQRASRRSLAAEAYETTGQGEGMVGCDGYATRQVRNCRE